MLRRRLAVLLLIFLAMPLNIPNIHESSSAPILNCRGDLDRISVAVNYAPGTDKYGKPSVNPDGTFYPGDQIWVSYSVHVGGDFFEGVEALFDQSVFEKIRDDGWGSTLGSALFKVKLGARSGTYAFTVKARGSETAKTGKDGSVTVTYGGVEVNAYYHAEYSLTILSAENGTSDPAPGTYWYREGSTVSVKAIPSRGYELDYWLLDNVNVGSSNPINVRMDAAHSLKPVFKRKSYTLTITVALGRGTTDPAPGTYVYYEEIYVTVTAIPDEGFVFLDWIVDGHTDKSNPITLYMDKSHSIAAIFVPENQGGSVEASPSGWVSGWVPPTSSPAASNKLIIKDLNFSTWFDVFRGKVFCASGYLIDSAGNRIAYSPVVVEFRKNNLFTNVAWTIQKVVWTNGRGYFVAEDSCNPLFESFLGVRAWAEKDGYLPSWSLSISVAPSSVVLGQDGAVLVGLIVSLSGRYTPVPVTVAASLPPDCSASFFPEPGEVDGLTPLQSTLLISAPSTAPIGDYAAAITVSSGLVSAEAALSIRITEPIRYDSAVTFRASGLRSDAANQTLIIDGNLTVNARMLPYTAAWKTGTQHSYRWMNIVSSTVKGKRYVFEEARVTIRYLSEATVEVEVVEYNPQFTITLIYTMPNGLGGNSYEKPFVVVLRYDGNGPEGNLGQRAIIENWAWSGYASRIPMQQGFISATDIFKPKLTVEEITKLFNATNIFSISSLGQVEFAISGIDGETEGVALYVDGEAVDVHLLPKSYRWPENTTHAYRWVQRLPVFDGGQGVWDEAFTFRHVLVMSPEIKGLENLVNGSGSQTNIEDLYNLISQSYRLDSPSGTVNATALGNRIVGVYSHDKLLDGVAGQVNVGHEALVCATPGYPIYFNNESRYAKLVFDLDDRVARQAMNLGYNTSITYSITLSNNMFTVTPHTIPISYTCPLEFYWKSVSAVAYKWSGAWNIDSTVRIEALFDAAFNFTEKEWFEGYFQSQNVDDETLKIALQDLYDCMPQYFAGAGEASGSMLRISPYYYNLNVTAGRGSFKIGAVPERDEWTEMVESKLWRWFSPASTVSVDSFSVRGSASIRVHGKGSRSASAILRFVRYIEATPSTTLKFKLYLGDGFSGNVTVYVEGGGGAVNRTMLVDPKKWIEVSVGGIPDKANQVGIYAELIDEEGSFRVDDLRFEGAKVWVWSEKTSIERTVYVDFAVEEPFMVYVNMDPNSPLQANVTSDTPKSSRILVDAVPELGGLSRIAVYALQGTPPSNLTEISTAHLRFLSALNLTGGNKPAEGIGGFNFYRGYTRIYGSVLGFSGQVEILINKDPTVVAQPGGNESLLLVEAVNVWGTKFRTVVSVQPYGKTEWEIMMEEVGRYIVYIVIAAVVISIAIYLVKGREPEEPIWRF